MSALSPAESAFAELLERCGLPDIATRELLEMFLEQSTGLVANRIRVVQLKGMLILESRHALDLHAQRDELREALEAAKRELATLRDTGAAKRAFDASVGRGEGPPALSIVRPLTDCGVLGCDQLACKGDVFNHRREIDDFGNLLPEASR